MEQLEHKILKKILDYSGSVFLLTDLTGAIVLINKRGCQVCRLTEKEAIGQCWIDLFIPEKDRDKRRRRFTEILGERSDRVEKFISAVGPLTESIEWQYSVLRDGQKNLDRLLVVGKDVGNGGHVIHQFFNDEQRLNAVITSLPIVLFALDGDGIFLLSEGKGLGTLGLEPGQVVGKSVFDVYRDFPAITQSCRRALSGEEFTSRVRVHGAIFEVRYSPVLDENRSLMGVIGVAWDITDQAYAEESLRQSEERYRQLVENMNEGLVITDEKGRITFANAKYYEMTGMNTGELIGHIPNFAQDKINLKILNEMWHSRKKLSSRTFELVLKHKNGNDIHILVSPRPLFDLNNNYVGNFAAVTDITERKMMEKKVIDQKEFYEDVLKHIPISICWKDKNHTYLGANEYFLTAMDIQNREDIIGKKADTLKVDKEQIQRILQTDDRVIETGEPLHNYEEKIIFAKGREHVFLSSKVPLRNREGAIIGLVAIDNDITELKAAEEALRRRDAVLRAVSFAAEQFLKWGEWDKSIHNIMEQIGRASRADVAFISKHHVRSSGQAELEQKVMWKTPEVRSEVDGRTGPGFIRFARWIDELSGGRVIQNHVPDLPADERQFFISHGIQSLVVVPVFVSHKWWGLFGLAATGSAIEWSVAEIDAIKSAANILGAGIQRRAMEESLKESESRFRRTFDQSPIGAAIVSLDFRYLRVNQALCNITGYSESEMRALRFIDITHPDDREKDLDMTRQLLEGKIDQFIEHKRYIRKDKKIVWIQLSVRLMKDSGGDPLYLLPMMEDITERRNSNIILKASLQEKELLLKEIHHRVKNNLQLVYSLLDLQSLNIEDKKAQQMLRNTQARVKSMALIHEELYKTPDLARIRMKSYVENMVHYLFNMYNTRMNPISLECDITDITMSIDMAIPCALIITELVSNSLKYAFSDSRNDKITIVLKRADNTKYSLIVSDNGRGLPDSVDIDNTPSLGLQIVKTLTRQLNGKLTLDKSPGTRYRIDFNTEEV